MLKRQENEKAKGNYKNNTNFKKPDDVRADTVDKLFADKTSLLNKKNKNLTDTKRKGSIYGQCTKNSQQNLKNNLGFAENRPVFTPENRAPSVFSNSGQKSKKENDNFLKQNTSQNIQTPKNSSKVRENSVFER